MADDVKRWLEVLEESDGLGTLDQYLDSELGSSLSEDIAWGGSVRSAMSRAGTGGDPLRSRGAAVYADDPRDKCEICMHAQCVCDPIEEALRMSGIGGARIDEQETDVRKRRISAINAIRGQLEYVWQSLGKAETKLGIAAFKADEVDFNDIESTIKTLVNNVKEVMARIEATREKVTL